jgi:hypothetical protein
MSLLSLSVIKLLDFTWPASPEGGAFFGVDPHTGYFSGGHFGGTERWEYVYDPATETYITINDTIAAPADTHLNVGSNVIHTYLRHPISGLQAVISSTTTRTSVHTFPGLAYQKRGDVTVPTETGWHKNTVVDGGGSDAGYALMNRTTTSVEIFRLTIDIAGDVTRTSIGTYGVSDFPGSVSTLLQLSDRSVPHYDSVTDTITVQHGTNPGSVPYVLNYDVATETVNWVSEAPLSDNNFGWPRTYARLAGGYWGYYGFTNHTYVLVNLVTGDIEERWGHYRNIQDNSAFWDDTIDAFYAFADEGVQNHYMLKTRYVTVTIASP